MFEFFCRSYRRHQRACCSCGIWHGFDLPRKIFVGALHLGQADRTGAVRAAERLRKCHTTVVDLRISMHLIAANLKFYIINEELEETDLFIWEITLRRWCQSFLIDFLPLLCPVIKFKDIVDYKKLDQTAVFDYFFFFS